MEECAKLAQHAETYVFLERTRNLALGCFCFVVLFFKSQHCRRNKHNKFVVMVCFCRELKINGHKVKKLPMVQLLTSLGKTSSSLIDTSLGLLVRVRKLCRRANIANYHQDFTTEKHSSMNCFPLHARKYIAEADNEFDKEWERIQCENNSQQPHHPGTGRGSHVLPDCEGKICSQLKKKLQRLRQTFALRTNKLFVLTKPVHFWKQEGGIEELFTICEENKLEDAHATSLRAVATVCCVPESMEVLEKVREIFFFTAFESFVAFGCFGWRTDPEVFFHRCSLCLSMLICCACKLRIWLQIGGIERLSDILGNKSTTEAVRCEAAGVIAQITSPALDHCQHLPSFIENMEDLIRGLTGEEDKRNDSRQQRSWKKPANVVKEKKPVVSSR